MRGHLPANMVSRYKEKETSIIDSIRVFESNFRWHNPHLLLVSRPPDTILILARWPGRRAGAPYVNSAPEPSRTRVVIYSGIKVHHLCPKSTTGHLTFLPQCRQPSSPVRRQQHTIFTTGEIENIFFSLVQIQL